MHWSKTPTHKTLICKSLSLLGTPVEKPRRTLHSIGAAERLFLVSSRFKAKWSITHPIGHDTRSTTAQSVDEVALIRDTISQYAPVLIARNSSSPVKATVARPRVRACARYGVLVVGEEMKGLVNCNFLPGSARRLELGTVSAEPLSRAYW